VLEADKPEAEKCPVRIRDARCDRVRGVRGDARATVVEVDRAGGGKRSARFRQAYERTGAYRPAPNQLRINETRTRRARALTASRPNIDNAAGHTQRTGAYLPAASVQSGLRKFCKCH
jgi:hypothetical protein